jgi:hypothetical protein
MRKIVLKLNNSKMLISRGLSLMVVFSVLIAAYVAVGLNPSFGWFAKNEKVTANGMNTMAYHSQFTVNLQKLALNDDGTTSLVMDNATMADILADLKVPGQSAIFNVTITSIGEYPVTLTGFGLEAPSADEEKPVIEATDQGNVERYLSTELSTELLSVDNESITVTKQVKPLRASDAASAGRIDYFDWLMLQDGVNEIVLTQGESVTFKIKFTFVNSRANQNIFKNYASTEKGGVCSRRLFLTFDESR